jgi:hypothetical protein
MTRGFYWKGGREKRRKVPYWRYLSIDLMVAGERFLAGVNLEVSMKGSAMELLITLCF